MTSNSYLLTDDRAGEERPALPTDFRQKTWYVLRTVLISGLLIAVFVSAANVFLFAFAGLLLAVLLSSLARGLSALTYLPYKTALLVVLLVLAGLIAVAGYLLAPTLTQQFDAFLSRLPMAIAEVKGYLQRFAWGRSVIVHFSAMEQWIWKDASTLAEAGGLLWATTTSLASLVLGFFLAFYLALEPQVYQDGIVALLRPGRKAAGRELLHKLGATLESWLWGQLLAMTIVGVFTGLGLWVLGVPLPLTLGIMAGLLAFIPNLGPVMFLVPALLLTFPQGGSQVLAVLALYVAIQTVESYFITPLVQQQMVHLPPALTIFAQVLMGVLFGFVGILVAVPLVALVLVAIKEVFLKHQPLLKPTSLTTEKEISYS